jgi:hypothetical protein
MRHCGYIAGLLTVMLVLVGSTASGAWAKQELLIRPQFSPPMAVGAEGVQSMVIKAPDEDVFCNQYGYGTLLDNERAHDKFAMYKTENGPCVAMELAGTIAALEYGVQTTKIKYKGLEAEINGGCWYALTGKVTGPSLAGSGFPGLGGAYPLTGKLLAKLSGLGCTREAEFYAEADDGLVVEVTSGEEKGEFLPAQAEILG